MRTMSAPCGWRDDAGDGVLSHSVKSMTFDPQRYDRTIALFDAANARDPHSESVDGKEIPRELLYAMRMSGMLERFAPEASEIVRLAVRAQHIERWKIPRSDYPKTSFGYRQWRTRLYKFHAETAGRLMREAGYDEEMIAHVETCVAKLGVKVNPETQVLEDIAALVFLEHSLAGFVAQHPEYDEAKWIDILRKTAGKMSPQGRAFALSGITLPAPLLPLVARAIKAIDTR